MSASSPWTRASPKRAYMAPFSLLMGQLAYEGNGGPEIAYRFERFT
ncbi:MAG: hypothetical protein ABIS29_11965 [Vicinamibacterales bacterium]